jgi:ABC-type glutathione transport system ATPase component
MSTSSAPVTIRANAISKVYGDFVAVHKLSFEVRKGTVAAFLGPNGAGKSTTMKMLTGYLAPSSGSVEVLGSLPRYATATGYIVTPVVGLVTPGFALRIDAFEVEEVFEPPLAFLMNPLHHERRLVEVDGLRRTFYAMPYEAGRRYFIWGATAAMLRNFYHLLRA